MTFADRPRASAVPAGIILCLAVPAYLTMLLSLVAPPALVGVDRALAVESALAALIVLWVLLAALLLLGGARGWMPRWAAIAACLLVPLSGLAASQCLPLVGVAGGEVEGTSLGMGAAALALVAANWPLAVVAALPMVLTVFAFWAHFPRLHRILPATPVSLLAVVAVSLLSAAPIALPRALASAAAPSVVEPSVVEPSAAVTAPAPPPPIVLTTPSAPVAPADPAPTGVAPTDLAPTDSAPTDFAGSLAQLTPDSPLASYLPYFAAGGALRRDALERARLLTNRQEDAEALLRNGMLHGMEDLHLLDLQATDSLCRAFGDQIAREAARERAPGGEQPLGFGIVADRLEVHLENLNWLVSAGCDLRAALHAVADTASATPASPERDRFIAAIGAMTTVSAAGAAAGAADDPAWCLVAASATPEQRIAGCTAIIRSGRAGFGRLTAAFVTRGNALDAAQAYDRAVADYSAALHFAPRSAQAGPLQVQAQILANRGNAYAALGDRAAAMRDFDAAIAAAPTLAMAFNDRGAAAEAYGEHASALPDLDQALRLDPHDANALANRGRAKFFLGRFAEAAADFEQARVLRPVDPTLLMWRMLAQAEAAHASVAQPPIRAQARADAEAIDPLTWPGALVSVYLGAHDPAWGLRAAAAADDRVKPLQACQAAFYLGEKTLLDGARATARALLIKATAPACPPRSVEAAAARSELARLGK